jgi:hypothetical protein
MDLKTNTITEKKAENRQITDENWLNLKWIKQREDASILFLLASIFLSTPHKLQINFILILSNRMKAPKEDFEWQRTRRDGLCSTSRSAHAAKIHKGVVYI